MSHSTAASGSQPCRCGVSNTLCHLLQITMTTEWLLLLVVVVSSQRVDSQSTTDDETCSEGGQGDIKRILENLQQLFQQQQTVMKRLGKS